MIQSSRYLEGYLQKCKDMLGDYASAAPEETIERYVQLFKDPAQKVILPKGVVGILDVHNLSFRYIMNTEFAVGISTEHFLEKGVHAYLESMVKTSLNLETIPFFMGFLIDSMRAVSEERRTSFLAYIYGIQNVRASGVSFRTLVQVKGLAFDEHGMPTLCLFHLEDIQHLTKNTVKPKMRISFEDNSQVFNLSMDEKILKKGDFFSDRELDILKCLLKGNESKEIAEKLFISPNTVDNHRKNMIRKMDARDTTALVHLSKMLGILR